MSKNFIIRDGCLWFDNGNSDPQQISDAFTVVGVAYDDFHSPHYIIEHKGKHFSLAWEDLGEKSAFRTMRKYIKRMPTNAKNKERLIEYIQETKITDTWILSNTSGWHNDAYVLPNGDILGNGGNVLFQQSQSYQSAYKPKGTLGEWQLHIGKYLAGNSRLCLFVGCAFATPLLKHFNLEGGILHIYGASSSGKSTAQRVALSVWGHGKEAGYSWNATGYALTNAAASRNDGLLSLDEIGEDSHQAVENCAYAIANGRGRLQGSKDGGNRPEVRYRVLAVSSGEITLKAHFKKNGREIMAGHIVRCPSIPHRLENAHDFDSFRAFAEHLNNAVVNYYGNAGRAFIEKLCLDKNTALKRATTIYTEFLDDIHNRLLLTSQMSRTARLFAMSATGLILASEWGITGISAEQAQKGIYIAFKDWYEEQPKVNIENIAVIEKITKKMPQLINRFVPIEMAGNPLHYPRDFVGFVEYTKSENEPNYYEILIPKFDEIFSCNDESTRKRIHNILGKQMAWLQKDEKRRSWRQRRKVNGEVLSVYRFLGIEPPQNNQQHIQTEK